MNPFDAVFELNALEKKALLAEDLDLLDEYLPKREEAIAKAIQSRAMFPEEEFRRLLLRLQNEQNELSRLATAAQAQVQASINNTKKQGAYRTGNAYAAQDTGKSFYCDKLS